MRALEQKRNQFHCIRWLCCFANIFTMTFLLHLGFCSYICPPPPTFLLPFSKSYKFADKGFVEILWNPSIKPSILAEPWDQPESMGGALSAVRVQCARSATIWASIW